jgi:hypothetical protein
MHTAVHLKTYFDFSLISFKDWNTGLLLYGCPGLRESGEKLTVVGKAS